MILVHDRSDALRIGLAGLARHPIDALGGIKCEPSLEFPGIEQFCFAQQEQLDFALSFVRQRHAVTA